MMERTAEMCRDQQQQDSRAEPVQRGSDHVFT
jgi:hypothetical protein